MVGKRPIPPSTPPTDGTILDTLHRLFCIFSWLRCANSCALPGVSRVPIGEERGYLPVDWVPRRNAVCVAYRQQSKFYKRPTCCVVPVGSSQIFFVCFLSWYPPRPETGSAIILIGAGEYHEMVNVTRSAPLTLLVSTTFLHFDVHLPRIFL